MSASEFVMLPTTSFLVLDLASSGIFLTLNFSSSLNLVLALVLN